MAVRAADPGAPLRPPLERARQASDALLSASGYVERGCSQCGAIVKVPPSIASRVTHCPRCRGALASVRQASGSG